MSQPRNFIVLITLLFSCLFLSRDAFAVAVLGPDIVERGSTAQYAVDSGGVAKWCVQGTGVSIESDGVVMLDNTACGSFTVWAESPDGTQSEKDVRVANYGTWERHEITGCQSTGGCSCEDTVYIDINYYYTPPGEYRLLFTSPGMYYVFGYQDGNLFYVSYRAIPVYQTVVWYGSPYLYIQSYFSGGWGGRQCFNGRTWMYQETWNTGDYLDFTVYEEPKWTCPGQITTMCVDACVPAAEVCDGEDNDCDGEIDEDVIDATISPNRVWPQKTGGDTDAYVTVWLKDPVPPDELCAIDLNVVHVPYSGGHDHHDALRKKGWLEKTKIYFSAGETGPEVIKYTSNEVSGTERIELRMDNAVKKELEVSVKVPNLYPMSGSYLRLTGGEETIHPDNHYTTVYAMTNTWLIAETYYELTETTLGINDMSIRWGGLFDINGNWSTPHLSHRTGEDVDIDRNVWDTVRNQYIEIWCLKDQQLKKLVEKYSGSLNCESNGRKHIDF